MKRLILLLSVAAAVGCSDSKKENQPANGAALSSTGNPYQDIAGTYLDTLPCADCRGILTEISLHEDSTFTLRERRLTAEGRPERPVNLKGVFNFLENSKIKLTSTKDSLGSRTFEVSKDGLIASGSASAPNVDNTLEMVEKGMGRIGRDFVSYKLSDSGKMPTMVFTHMPGSDIVINKPAIDKMKDGEKAILAYYASMYNSGCDGDNCAIETAMGFAPAKLSSFVKEKITDLTLPSDEELNASKSKMNLVLVMFNVQDKNVTVNYNAMSTDRMMTQGSDIFELTENGAKLVKKGNPIQQGRPNPQAVQNAKPNAQSSSSTVAKKTAPLVREAPKRN
jgi:uncharacterized lipoprotein NlpE involved in copper resistance